VIASRSHAPVRFSWPKSVVNGGLSNDGLVITVRGGPGASRRARRAIGVMARDLARPIDHVRLLVTELVTSSVKHGNVGADGQVSLDVSLRGGVVRVTVTDAGPGFEEATPPDADPAANGGFGRLIVDRLAKRWGLSRSGRSAWFEVQRQRVPELTSIAASGHA
jgi:anti-sigma regulatory factor (Ser/Thr protein kinase)